MRQPNASVTETSHPATPPTVGAAAGPKLAHVTEQPGLPIKFDSKRGCDQIRARLYHDPRLVGLELTVALALSEFVRLPACVAYPKQKLLTRMVHATRARVSNALQRLETKGVLTIDRGRSHCRYVFLETWRGRFQTVPRCAGKAHLDVPGKHISKEKVTHVTPIQSRFSLGEGPLEPYVLEPVRTLIAAADLSLVQSGRDDQQQQQIKSEQRVEGQIASCEISARVLDVDFDAADHRERMQSGELSLEESQAFTDGLRLQRDDRMRRKGKAR